MRAAVYYKYGSPEVVELLDVPTPELTEGRVRVRVKFSSANPYDWHFIRGEPYFMRLMTGLRVPKRPSLGVDFAGTIESVGQTETDFQVGDEVYGMWHGAFAEYLNVPLHALANKPATLTLEAAAGVPLAGLTALQGLRDVGQLQPGERVLIIGASGGVGTLAVQIAKSMDAQVTGVCSTRNIDLVKSLGADDVIDYTREQVLTESRTYDVIFQLSGLHTPSQCRRALSRRGRLVLSSGDSEGRWIGPLDRILKAALLSPFVSQDLIRLDTATRRQDLEALSSLVDAGKISLVVDRKYTLDEVSEAVGYVEAGRSRGKVLIEI